jgi:hypothetical protein
VPKALIANYSGKELHLTLKSNNRELSKSRLWTGRTASRLKGPL